MRSWRTFALGAGLVLGALAVVTWRVFDLEQSERAAIESARIERVVGEALLRMDLAVTPFLAAEAARPRSSWGAATPADEMSARLIGHRFTIAADDSVSTSAPDAPALPIAELRAAAPPIAPTTELVQQGNALRQKNVDTQSLAGRQQLVQNYNFANGIPTVFASEPVGVFRAVFVGSQTATPSAEASDHRLFFVRRTGRGGGAIEGIEADWPAFERWLIEQSADLLPAARLRPLANEETDATRRLASLPAVLLPGTIRSGPDGVSSPVPWLLLATWLVVLAALGVVGFAVHAATALGERRARFVSSVTHELRTPLTTFRMYSQMLASGMVPEGKREQYLNTLQSESERLVRIVESVLLYSRLEGGRGGAHRVDVTAVALVEPVLARLQQRCREAQQDFEHTIELDEDARLHLDPQAVEQVLTNLVDNACKYAPGGPIRFRAETTDRELLCSVRDEGPGIPEALATTIFRAFHRGDEQRTGSTPGLGLGLAIARELAEACGGTLELRPATGRGSTFVLRLPLGEGPATR